jgi:hypothetical protein
MNFTVELENQIGGRATKEFEVSSYQELRQRLSQEVQDYSSQARLIGVWENGQPGNMIRTGAW